MRKVEVEHMLAARDRRVDIQNKLLEEGGSECCLACLTLNIAGEIKRTPMTVMLFKKGISEFEKLDFDVRERLIIDEFTGSEAFWLVKEDGARVKARLEEIEDSFPAARLFDFDVLVPGGEKLSRSESRRCLICDKPAAGCARSRAHGLDTIKEATQNLLKDFCAEELAEEAHSALLSEVYATPKPGLVDLNNNGAHDDMDVPMFEKSADALRPYFHDAAILGMEGCAMAQLRERGLAAEKEMFAATGGVNTHKGMIYSMGLLLAGMGKALTDTDIEEEDICNAGLRAKGVSYAAALAGEDAEQMLARARVNPDTNGAAVLREYGALGATGHAAAGFPDAVFTADRLAYYKKEGLSDSDAGVLALCDCMARVEDTNLLHRGGVAGLEYAKETAKEIAGLPMGDRIAAMRDFDQEMINRNLSPGGSADMLAIAFLLSERA